MLFQVNLKVGSKNVYNFWIKEMENVNGPRVVTADTVESNHFFKAGNQLPLNVSVLFTGKNM